jgi:hypothetical protein
MTAEEALLKLITSPNYAEFQARRAEVVVSIKNVGKADIAAVIAQNELLQRRENLIAGQQALAAERAAEAAKVEAEAKWKRAEAPMFSDAQRKFVRQAEFLQYLQTLDELILKFDRSSNFNLQQAIDTTTTKLHTLRTTAVDMRETFGAVAAMSPGFPRRFFKSLVGSTFIRYIRWQAAPDLDR